ncbi:glycosyltransferase family 4 protein [Caproicibacterium sp. NSD3]
MAATPPPVGGIATWTLRMLNISQDYGCQYYLVDEKMIGHRDMFGNNTKHKFNDEVKRCFGIWKNLSLQIKENDINIVQSCIPSSTLSMLREYVCACITKNKKKKFIINFHCTVPNTQKGILWNLMIKKICKKSDRIFVLNDQSKKYLEKITTTKIEVIPNFVEEQEIVKSHVINENIFSVLYVGGVIKSKGVLDIINVAKEFPKIIFKLVGNPEQDVIDAAKKVPNVIITGIKTKKEVQEELKKADVFMFLSKFKGEGFSMALLEAMASGLPCIVTDWAANGDMIGNEGGITVCNSKTETIVKAIENMENPQLRKSYSERNIRVVNDYYSSKVLFSNYVSLYNEIINGK